MEDIQKNKNGSIYFFDFLLKEKILLIPAAAGSSPSMQPLVFWPRVGAFGAGVILELRAQLLRCELYAMKGVQKENKLRGW